MRVDIGKKVFLENRLRSAFLIFRFGAYWHMFSSLEFFLKASGKVRIKEVLKRQVRQP